VVVQDLRLGLLQELSVGKQTLLPLNTRDSLLWGQT
jgi:hypothetical protein